MLSRNYANEGGSRTSSSLPSQIKCHGHCKYPKPPGCFSTKQLDILHTKLRSTPSFDAAKMPLIKCTSCTSQQVVELYCQGHEQWMGLDKFYKTQRKTPDDAYCIKCVTERVEDEPYEPGRDDDEIEYYDPHHVGSDDDDDDFDDHPISDATSSMAALSVSHNVSTYPSQSGSSLGGVRLNTNTVASSVQNTPRPTASNAGTSSTVGTGRSDFYSKTYSMGSSKKEIGGAWAKPPAGPPKPKTKLDSDDEDDKEVIYDSD